MKNFTRVFLALVLALSLSLSLVACGDKTSTTSEDNNQSADGSQVQTVTTYDITIWCAENAVNLTKAQVAAYNELESTKAENIYVNATVNPVGEGEAATSMITDVEAGADIYCFAQDQFARLVQAGALSKLSANAQSIVKAANDGGTVAAAQAGEELYAYPMTSDNGYFMYYDKSVVAEEHIDSLEDIIADCKAAGKKFSFELEGSAWYTASFFFATGCHSDWTTDDDGKFITVSDNFNSAEGLIAVKGMKKLVGEESVYVNSSKGADFSSGSAVVVSGTWDYNAVLEQLGDNFGAADLPSFTVDGTSYHLGSFSGCKLMGVKPQVNATKAAICHNLAQYLTGYDCQKERFEELSWGPANLQAQQLDAVQENAGLAALLAQSNYAVPQGQIHGSWWDIAKVIGTAVANATDDAGLQAALDAYKASIEGLFNMSEDEKNAWTVIGSINGDGWTVDLAMTEQDDGTWKTNEAYEMDAGVEFKVRQGKSWDVSFGNGGGNYVVETAGTYYIVADVVNQTITLVAAE